MADATYQSKVTSAALTALNDTDEILIFRRAPSSQHGIEFGNAVGATSDVFARGNHSHDAVTIGAAPLVQQLFVLLSGTVAYARTTHGGKVLRSVGGATLNAADEAQIQLYDVFAVRQADASAPTVNLPSGSTKNGTEAWAQNSIVYYHCVDASAGAYVFDLSGSIS